MKFGIIGLGRMGLAIARRVHEAGHQVYGFDLDESARLQASQIGITVTEDIASMPTYASIIWIMVPAGKPVDSVINQLLPALQPNQILIDGGNSNFHDSIERAERLKKSSIAYLDCGTSGGLLGETIGFSLMIGGSKDAFNQVEPFFKVIAAPTSYGLVGPSGAGHYVKMIHNGIEYALLQAYAEGFDLIKNGYYKNLDLAQITGIWQDSSVVRSWILDLAHDIFVKDQQFTNISGKVAQGGTGQWTVEQAHKEKIPVALIEESLKIREWSQKTGGNYATKIVALLRNAFGGHSVEKES